jgi:hypothetical protein
MANDISQMESVLQQKAKDMDLSILLGTVLLEKRFYSFYNRADTADTAERWREYGNDAIPVVELLIKYGADLNRPINGYYVRSHSAFDNKSKEPANSFYESDDDHIYYPLYWAIDWAIYSGAVSKGAYLSVQLLEYLLDNGAEIESKNVNYDRTPLMAATYYSQINVVKLLVERGANVNAVDSKGSSVIEITSFSGYSNVNKTEAFNYLKAHGAETTLKEPLVLVPLSIGRGIVITKYNGKIYTEAEEEYFRNPAIGKPYRVADLTDRKSPTGGSYYVEPGMHTITFDCIFYGGGMTWVPAASIYGATMKVNLDPAEKYTLNGLSEVSRKTDYSQYPRVIAGTYLVVLRTTWQYGRDLGDQMGL